MPNFNNWAPNILAILRIVTALLFLEHATMKFLQFPAAIPGVGHPLPTILMAAGLIEAVTSILVLVGYQTRISGLHRIR